MSPFRLWLLLLLILVSGSVSAQKEASIWYFGDSAGVKFEQTGVNPLTDGVMKTREGCASIADKQGNLLFYTDGESIWNKFHMLMPNGTRLKGNRTSTQSAVIVKQPGKESIYYIFTANGLTGNKELGSYYTIVDMSLNWGMGDVQVKNVELLQQPAEKICAVLHENGTDIWVAVAERETLLVHTFLLTENGVSGQSIKNDIGTDIDGWAGYMKFSPQGDKLALVQLQKNTLVMAKFDHRTGVISAPRSVWLDSPYGLEFSPDGKQLYVSLFYNTGNIVIQYSADASDTDAIKASAFAVLTGSRYNNYVHALQLGIDGKIYFVQFDRDSLGVIEYPNAKQNNCGVRLNAVPLQGRKNILGLPCFMESFFSLKPDDIAYKTHYKNCNYDVAFALNDTTGIDSVWWDFGDAASGMSDKSRLMQPTHRYANPGTYTVTLIVERHGQYHTTTRQVFIQPANSFYMPDTLYQCNDDPLLLNHWQPKATYLWNTGAVTPAIQAWLPGNYKLTLTDSNGCVHTDSTLIIRPPLFKPDLGRDTALCYADVLKLSDQSLYGFKTYHWSTGDSSRIIFGKQKNRYILNVTDKHGCATADTVDITSKSDRPQFLPNAFSPNGDDINDRFLDEAYAFPYDEFKVVNRWGEILFSNTNSTIGWDGVYKGAIVEQDAYVYLISYHDCSNRRQNISGTVTVIR